MTAPYYDDGTVALWHGDCREITAWLEADVLVTDPPYGTEPSNGYRSGLSTPTRRVRNLPSTNQARSIAGDADVSVRDAALTLWGGGRPAVVFGSPLRPLPSGAVQALVYVKPLDAGAIGARSGWRRDIESVYLCGSGWPQGAPVRSSVLRTGARTSGNPSGLAARYGGHSHAKPVDVLEALIATCPPGVIADPFAGSGSTLVAARNLGRRAVGVELEERYCKIAARRLAQDVLDLTGADS